MYTFLSKKFLLKYIILERNLCSRTVFLRLVFTSDGVLVGVIVRSVERYDLIKIIENGLFKQNYLRDISYVTTKYVNFEQIF